MRVVYLRIPNAGDKEERNAIGFVLYLGVSGDICLLLETESWI